MISLVLVVEDHLSEEVANALLRQSGQQYVVEHCLFYNKTEIQKKINDLKNASQGFP